VKVELVCNVLGDVVHVTKPSAIVGRGSEADVRIDDRDVSRRHCEILVRPDGVIVRDLGSTHGTWYEGRRIDGEIRIAHRSRVALAENGIPVEILRARVDGRPVMEEASDAALASSHTVGMSTSEVHAAKAVSGGSGAATGEFAAPRRPLFLRGFLVGAAVGLAGGLAAFLR
jgi:pSer/pThr/pTyr-binding forkhead associated (FHA) protein